ncbi:MAG: hypothetical protein ACOX5Z_09435 [Desulfobulbus sp.]|jgi:uncharacterized membrane protein
MIKKKSPALQLARLIALAAMLLTAGQIAFTLHQGKALCLNSGCALVEQLTRVPGLALNIAGLLFFLLVYGGLSATRGEWRRTPEFLRVLLWTGLAAEAVLIGFQYWVVGVWCIYCLLLAACILLINLCLGGRQCAVGALLFAGVFLAFSSLQLIQPLPERHALNAGVFASRTGILTFPQHHLFYASTCSHCETIIADLRDNRRVTLLLHPVDRVDTVSLPDCTLNPGYTPELNKSLLASLGITEVPVLISTTSEGLEIRQGEQAIATYFRKPPENQPIGQSHYQAPSDRTSHLPLIPGIEEDGCQVSGNCSGGQP